MELKRRGKWTSEEDAALVSAVSALGKEPDGRIVFSEVAKQVAGRTPKQAQERWENHLRPGLKKGPWTDSETAILLEEICRHGQEWFTIIKALPDRGFHSVKVKGRWLLGEVLPRRKLYDPPVAKKPEWSSEEVSELLRLHQHLGYDINAISHKLPFFRSIAGIERKILKFCKCDRCSDRMREYATSGETLKTSWSKKRARELLHEKNLLPVEPDEYEEKSSTIDVIVDQRKRKTDVLNGKSVGRRRVDEGSSELTENSNSYNNCVVTEENSTTDLYVFMKQIKQMVEQFGFDKLKKTFCKYMSGDQLLQLISSSRDYANFSMINPSLNYMLHLKLDNEFQDKRYDLDFLFPKDCNSFHENEDRPVGTIVFQNGTCLALDGDRYSTDMLGDPRGRHFFDLQASPLNGFFVYGNMYARLVENGEVWCHQLLVGKEGKVQVFLVHVEFGYFGPHVCRFSFQNVSDKFQDLLDLPPEF